MSMGRVLGWLIVAGFALTLMNYVVKRVHRKWFLKMAKDAPARLRFQALLRFLVQNHRFFGMFTTAALLAHLTLQFLSWGFYWTGFLAGGLLVLQGALGGFGHYVRKKKSGPWLVAHRTVAVLLPLAMLLHILTAKLT